MSYLGSYLGISGDISTLVPALNAIIVGDGASWVTKVDDLARTALGLGSTNNVTFNALEVATKITRGGNRWIHAHGVDSIHVGKDAANETSAGATGNTTLGVRAFQTATSVALNCTSVGMEALMNNAGAQNNTGVGYFALRQNTASGGNGTGNVALGARAGSLQAVYTDCFFIGRDADATANGLQNSGAIGAGATVGASNQLIIGSAGTPLSVGLSVTPSTGLRLTVGGSMGISALGEYRVGSFRVVGARATGWTAASGTAVKGGFDTSTVTLSDLAKSVKALIDDLIAHGLIGT